MREKIEALVRERAEEIKAWSELERMRFALGMMGRLMSLSSMKKEEMNDAAAFEMIETTLDAMALELIKESEEE